MDEKGDDIDDMVNEVVGWHSLQEGLYNVCPLRVLFTVLPNRADVVDRGCPVSDALDDPFQGKRSQLRLNFFHNFIIL